MGTSLKLINGDCFEELDNLADSSVDCIITDPPYGLVSSKTSKRGFMGKEWDGSGIEVNIEFRAKCLRVLKPGGYLCSFGGSRTFHRIACSIEDAGFELRDILCYLYGSGMPKSMSIAKGIEARAKYGKANTVAKRQIEQDGDGKEYTIIQTNNGIMGEKKEFTRKEYAPQIDEAKEWQNWGTCLKPGYEPIILARKPFRGSLIDNILENRVGGLNIDECRIPYQDDTDKAAATPQGKCTSSERREPDIKRSGRYEFNRPEQKGRFPANVILSYDEETREEVCGGFPDTKGGGRVKEKGDFGYCFGEKRADKPMADGYDDSGSAARYFMNFPLEYRYFYGSKASTKDRNEGLDDFEIKTKVFNGHSSKSSKDMKDIEKRFTTRMRNIHPTVKSTDLMRWLVRLVAPKGAVILDPFMGSGSTGKAVMRENKENDKNYSFIGIEKEKEYFDIAEARIKFEERND